LRSPNSPVTSFREFSPFSNIYFHNPVCCCGFRELDVNDPLPPTLVPFFLLALTQSCIAFCFPLPALDSFPRPFFLLRLVLLNHSRFIISRWSSRCFPLFGSFVIPVLVARSPLLISWTSTSNRGNFLHSTGNFLLFAGSSMILEIRVTFPSEGLPPYPSLRLFFFLVEFPLSVDMKFGSGLTVGCFPTFSIEDYFLVFLESGRSLLHTFFQHGSEVCS